jgi:autotransporter passenger strand-loop-strand repeat protein
LTELKGGYELVASGGIVSGATISAGTLEVASGAIASPSEAAFVGGGMLLLDASASFHGLVAGFGSSDQLDLPDVAFVTATTKKGQHSNLSFTDAASMAPTLPHPAARPIHGERVRRGKRRTRRHPHQFHVATLRLARYFALSAPLR